jgi:hypothetical protein
LRVSFCVRGEAAGKCSESRKAPPALCRLLDRCRKIAAYPDHPVEEQKAKIASGRNLCELFWT